MRPTPDYKSLSRRCIFWMKAGFERRPISSTQDSRRKVTEEVGAHEFRNRFGLYMERAAAGAEVLVNRRGRPYVRMGPQLKRIRLARRPG